MDTTTNTNTLNMSDMKTKSPSPATHTTTTIPPPTTLYRRIRANHTLQKTIRVPQFLSSLVSLALFSARLVRILRTVRRASTSNGAVEGILAAAVTYTLFSMLMKFLLKRGGPKWLRWIWIILDLGFVAGFIAVAILTSPGRGGSSGPCHRVGEVRIEPKGANCDLPWGTFLLAILSTLLHAITATFNEVRDSHKQKHEAAHSTAEY